MVKGREGNFLGGKGRGVDPANTGRSLRAEESRGILHAGLNVISLISRQIPFSFGIGLQDLVNEEALRSRKSKRGRGCGRGYYKACKGGFSRTEERGGGGCVPAERHASVALEMPGFSFHHIPIWEHSGPAKVA